MFAPGALRSTLTEVVPDFKNQTGHSIRIQYGAAGPLASRVCNGEMADAVVLSRAEVDRLAKEGRIGSGTNPTVAMVGIGVMVRKGQSKPDVSDVGRLKDALRQANTIAIVDPAQGAAGAYLMKTFSSWGMGNELKLKIRALPPGDGLYAVVEEGVAE